MRYTEGSIVAGRFVIERFVDSGGMGSVFQAQDRQGGRPVALKFLDQQGSAPLQLDRFMREAALLEELRHPGIVTYVAHGLAEGGEPYLAMEWLEGETLASRLGRGALSFAEVRRVIRSLAEALALAHGRGVIHRDLKPQNIFLCREPERVVLLDFGIARRGQASQKLTRTGAVLGTPGYMAPEQVRGISEIGPSADVFALGCVLFEGLTGAPPFVGEQILTVLAKILFEEPPPLRSLRPDLPEELEILLARMLAKDPGLRPKDASELLGELGVLDAPAAGLEGRGAPVRPPPRALGSADTSMFSVVVATPPSTLGDQPTLDERDAEELQGVNEALREALARLGAQVEILASGVVIAVQVQREHTTAKDQAAQAARCALVLQEHIPEAQISVATGRGSLHGRLPVGEAFDRAGRIQRWGATSGSAAAPPASIVLDAVTAGLLDARFRVVQVGEDQFALRGEQVNADEARTLLGRPTPCLGRDQELTALELMLTTCLEEPAAQAMLVVGPPGLGKSRLRHEFLRRLRDRRADIEVLIGGADPMSPGVSYGVPAQALRRLFGIAEAQAPSARFEDLRRAVAERLPVDAAARVTEFLAEMCGCPASGEGSPLLRAAREDPRIMRDQIHNAFVDFLRASCGSRPVLLVLEDLHWSDALTVSVVDVALRELSGQPLMVLALARPEIADRFPGLWAERAPQVIHLRGLSNKASERLVRAMVGPDVSARAVARVVEQAGGNALFLEELIRALSEGREGEQPASVLAMLQSRLLRLPPGARRALCGASVFGERFWRGGVLALLKGSVGSGELEGWFDLLVAEEIVAKQRESRFVGEVELRFRHALVRDAAYGLLDEADTRLGHRLAGAYLEDVGEMDAVALAEHAERGGDPARAVTHYLRAAEQLYASNNPDAAMACIDRALACGAGGEKLGRLRAIQAVIRFWKGDLEEGGELGSEALELSPSGSLWWCRAMGVVLSALTHTHQVDRMGAYIDRFVSAALDVDAHPAFVEASGVLLDMLGMLGMREAARPILERMRHVGAELADRHPIAKGWMHYGESWLLRMTEPEPWSVLNATEQSVAAFKEAMDARGQVNSMAIQGLALAELGDAARGAQTLREGRELALRHGESTSVLVCDVCLAILLVNSEPIEASAVREHARAIFEQKGAGSTLITGLAHHSLALVWLGEGQLEEAEAEARLAIEDLHTVPMHMVDALTALIRVLLARGRIEEALAAAAEGLDLLERHGGAGYNEVALRLAAAEARRSAGDEGGARQALAIALQVIDLRASRVPDPEVRARMLERVPANARALALAKAWGLAT